MGSKEQLITYPCDKCGACCKQVHLNAIYHFLDRGDGVCTYFDEVTKLCKIYENRPTICRVDAMYEIAFKDQMTKESYYQLNKAGCQKLKNNVDKQK